MRSIWPCFASGLAIARVAADVARAGARPQGRRLRVGADGVRRRRARHVHGDAGGCRRRERHPACASMARRGCSTGRTATRATSRLALQGEPARVIGRGDPGLAAANHRPGPHAARPSRGLARGLRQYLRARWRRSAWRARWAKASPDASLSARSRKARTRWRSSRPCVSIATAPAAGWRSKSPTDGRYSYNKIRPRLMAIAGAAVHAVHRACRSGCSHARPGPVA